MNKFFSLNPWICSGIFFLMAGCSKNIELKSPSSGLSATFSIDKASRLMYAVTLNGHEVVGLSTLGVIIDQVDLGKDAEITVSDYSSFNEKYAMSGIHDTAFNHYNEVVIQIVNKKKDIRYKLEARAFNDGIAYRYIIPVKGAAIINGESSSWKIPDSSTIWYQENVYYYEGLHYSSLVSELGAKHLGPPVTYRTPDGIYASITEAALYQYSGMSLRSDSTGILHSSFINDPRGWKIQDTVVTPWRVTLASTDLNGLVNADIINNLNPAPESSLSHADWIKPGRGVWSYFMHDNVTTVELEKSYADKAAKLGFEYNIVDAGWEESWPDKWNTLKELVNYSRKKGIGTWVWKGYAALKNDSLRRDFFRLLTAAGVVGVKIDFIDKEGIDQVLFYENALKDAAAFHLMINFHGANKPTGYSRRFPNELTREAIYGQEWRTYTPQGAINNVTLPFTRFLAGPADYTPGVFNSSKAYGTSWSHQLALPVIFYSPVMCWPEDPDVYLASSASAVIRSMPVVWDQTIVLPQSKLGKTAAFARRKGNDWFIGIINSDNDTSFTLPLSFAGPGNYEADIFKDDLSSADNMFASKTSLTSADSLPVTMRPKGGFVVKLTRTNKRPVKLTVLPEGGYLEKPALVSMSSNDNQSEIRYTTDSREPDAQSLLYSKPFILRDSMLIKSRIFKNGQPEKAMAVSQFLLAPAPVTGPDGSIFIDSQKITLKGGSGGGVIYYTSDGSTPTLSSEKYKSPVILKNSAAIKSRIFFNNGIASGLAVKVFTKVIPHPAIAEDPGGKNKAGAGLNFNYYEGAWTTMPSFKTASAKRSGVAPIPDIKGITGRETDYGIEFYGFIEVPATGVYSFYTISDDGSQLFIDNEKVVDNDGQHGDLEKTGDIALAKGKHFFRTLYFQSSAGISLKTYIKGPGLEKQEIPAHLFSHQ